MVAVVDLLVVLDGRDSVSGPAGVGCGRQIVLFADEHGDWDLGDLGNIDDRWFLGAVLLTVLIHTVVEFSEFGTLDELSEMHDLLPGGGLREPGAERSFFVVIVVLGAVAC